MYLCVCVFVYLCTCVFVCLCICVFVYLWKVPIWSPRRCSCQMMGVRDGANWPMGHCRWALGTTSQHQCLFSCQPNIIRLTACLKHCICALGTTWLLQHYRFSCRLFVDIIRFWACLGHCRCALSTTLLPHKAFFRVTFLVQCLLLVTKYHKVYTLLGTLQMGSHYHLTTTLGILFLSWHLLVAVSTQS